MTNEQALSADLASLIVPQVGWLVEVGDAREPYRLVDAEGVAAWFAELQARGRSVATVRSYGTDLVRWFRFLWALGVPWERATRSEARDFSRWLVVAGKPARPHWRHPDEP